MLVSFQYLVRGISQHKSRIVEGEIRAKELAEYLKKMNCSNDVWISEDATVITSKIIYDPKSDELIGLVLPTDEVTGCPRAHTYKATNAEIIKKHLMESKSTVLYIVMAQPINECIPPFVLQMYGSDNKFRTTDVLKRWKYTKTELGK